MALEREVETYKEHFQDLVKNHEDQIVIIKGDKILGFCNDYESALSFGYQNCGLESFLMKKVERNERPILITRLIVGF